VATSSNRSKEGFVFLLCKIVQRFKRVLNNLKSCYASLERRFLGISGFALMTIMFI
jgi:hypothetical protein